MSETRLAHFQHRWEAEFAQGYLDDAGIPSRLVSDGAGGGQPYAGLLAGASVAVASERAEEARAILVSAGLLSRPGQPTPAEPPPDLPLVMRADYDDLTEQLEAARKDEVKHALRSMLGITPAAVIPLVGLALEGNTALLALLCVLVVFVEGWKWIQAGRRVRRLQVALTRLEEEAEEL